jgi:hypothetical protein
MIGEQGWATMSWSEIAVRSVECTLFVAFGAAFLTLAIRALASYLS